MYELLGIIPNSIYTDTPPDSGQDAGGEAASTEPTVDSTSSEDVIEIEPDKLYRLKGSKVDPQPGEILWQQRMLHKDYTQKRQQETEQLKSLEQLVEQKNKEMK